MTWTLHPYNETHGGNTYTDPLSGQVVIVSSMGSHLECTTLVRDAPVSFRVEFSDRERFFEKARNHAILWARQKMLQEVPSVVARAKVVQKDNQSGQVSLFDMQ